MTQFSYTSVMNCRIASSVCGEVGFEAMELEVAREAAAAPRVLAREDVDDAMPPAPPAPPTEEGSWGGWCRRMKRVPEGVRKADI